MQCERERKKKKKKKKKNTLRVYRRGLANDRRGLGWSLVLFLFFSFLSFFFFFFFFLARPMVAFEKSHYRCLSFFFLFFFFKRLGYSGIFQTLL